MRRLPCRRKQKNEKNEKVGQQKPPRPEMIKLYQITRYSSPRDTFIMILGIVFAVCAGFAAPWIAVVSGNVIAIYSPLSTN